MMRWIGLIVIFALFGTPAMASTDRLNQAIAAYEAGRLVEARRVMTEVAESGSAAPQFRLGMMLIEGDGGEHDPSAAVLWLRRAARAGPY